MSKVNALSGLIGNYGDSDDESDDGAPYSRFRGLGNTAPVAKPAGSMYSAEVPFTAPDQNAAIHPAPIAHCPWSACYDENSGFTYYWNQQTNAVTWEAPPEYLLALKLAQQQLHTAGSTEVSAEEWQLYQQALAEKQNSQQKIISKPPTVKPAKKISHTTTQNSKKRRFSDDEDVKIELITSYHNSDSDSNDEESPVKPTPVAIPKAPKVPVAKVPAAKVPTAKLPSAKLPTTKAPATKVLAKKPKKNHKVIEYGPQLPPNQNYSVPIGPELPLELVSENTTTVKENNVENSISKSTKSKVTESEDSQDESLLLTKLKDKAKILEKLGGELPVELQKIILEETVSKSSSPPPPPVLVEDKNSETKSVIDTNIDDLLEEIEKKELPKIAKSKAKIDMFSSAKHGDSSPKHSPKPPDDAPSEDVVKPLFPSSKNISDEPPVNLFPSASNSQEYSTEKDKKEIVAEKKTTNVYLMDANEGVENVSRKKLRISNSVLPVKKSETPAYTTKYSQFIEGFTTERTGLGFSKDDEETNPKNTVSYGNGLLFTKGETLHDEKKDEDLQDLTDLLGMKLKFLNQLQPCNLSPVQEMLIQMQTLSSAFSAGGVSREYWWRWARAAAAALARHEAAAAPPGWRAAFLRSEGRYRYERESDGLVQWEYPAATNMDMDICTTPPHPGIEAKEESVEASSPPVPVPSAPVAPPLPPPPPPPPRTPPPPSWDDPPPPGCDDAPPLPPEPEIGDELQSFYNDIAKLEKQTPSTPNTASNSPEPPLPEERDKDKAREKDKDTKSKKKSKVKISSSIGMKHKSVSNLVAKWQQVAEEINSD